MEKAAVDRSRPPSRVWLHEVAIGVTALRAELGAVRAHDARAHDAPAQEEVVALCAGVEELLSRAEDAAEGVNPSHQLFWSWWNGNGIEAAFQNLHRAEAEIVKLYDDEEVDANAPEAVARISAGLDRNDARCIGAQQLLNERFPPGRAKRLLLSKTIQIGHEIKDRQFAKIRKFRNIVLLTATLILGFMLAFAVVVSNNPNAVPLCFTEDRGLSTQERHCPTSEEMASFIDIWIVALLGLLGGSLAAAVSIKNIRGAPSPYNLAIALAFLKVPTGALTAVGALIILTGQFVPGFSALDSPEQILAYALVFGYAQQLLTGLIDRRALTLVSSLPSKDAESVRGSAPQGPGTWSPMPVQRGDRSTPG